jgi:hypothetical protein
MSKPNLRRPSAGLLLGALALIVAVAGNTGAFAGTKVTKVVVRKGQIAKGAVSAKALAPGAVHPAAISKGAVGLAALRPGSVDSSILAPGAVTDEALAPGAVYGGALGEVTLHSAPIVDADAVPANNEWTISAPATASCGSGERVLSGGVVFTNPADKEVGIVASQPFVNGSGNGWVGAITTNAGGAAKAEVQALCLK